MCIDLCEARVDSNSFVGLRLTMCYDVATLLCAPTSRPSRLIVLSNCLYAAYICIEREKCGSVRCGAVSVLAQWKTTSTEPAPAPNRYLRPCGVRMIGWNDYASADAESETPQPIVVGRSNDTWPTQFTSI